MTATLKRAHRGSLWLGLATRRHLRIGRLWGLLSRSHGVCPSRGRGRKLLGRCGHWGCAHGVGGRLGHWCCGWLWRGRHLGCRWRLHLGLAHDLLQQLRGQVFHQPCRLVVGQGLNQLQHLMWWHIGNHVFPFTNRGNPIASTMLWREARPPLNAQPHQTSERKMSPCVDLPAVAVP